MVVQDFRRGFGIDLRVKREQQDGASKASRVDSEAPPLAPGVASDEAATRPADQAGARPQIAPTDTAAARSDVQAQRVYSSRSANKAAFVAKLETYGAGVDEMDVRRMLASGYTLDEVLEIGLWTATRAGMGSPEECLDEARKRRSKERPG